MVSQVNDIEGEVQDAREPLTPALYTLEQVGELMGMVGYPAIWGHYSSGSLPWTPLKVGRKIFFRRSEVNETLRIEE